MAFFDQMSQKLTQTSRDAVKKTKDMAEVVKLNNALSEEQHRTEEYYREIGKLYYQNFADRDEELFRNQIMQIRHSEKMIVEMKRTIQQLKGLVSCPTCGKEQPSDQAFCNACGAKMPKVSAVVPPIDGIVCKSCGTVLQTGMVFCTNCGAKLKLELNSDVESEI